MRRLKKSGWLETAFLLVGYLERYRVDGDSMTPTLVPGDMVVVDPNGTLYEGDIVVARHPYRRDVVMIKRIGKMEDDGQFFLISDNPEGSKDSRTFGAVPLNCIKGKAVALLES